MSHDRSEYLRYLPAFLRESATAPASRPGGPDADELGLADFLLIFQKILTGVSEGGAEDAVAIARRGDGRTFEPLEAVIDQLDRFFDPFRTDDAFLPWLASWVGLELRPDWTPGERRKMIARMVRVVRRVGLKAGLHDFLEIYANETIRPRVSIDDNEALFRVVLRPDGTARVSVLAFAQVVGKPGDGTPLLYRPSAIAVVPGGAPEDVRYAVADAGLLGRSFPPPLPASLWLLKPNGELDDIHWDTQGPGMPTPRPLNQFDKAVVPNTLQLTLPVALASDGQSLLVLERGYTYKTGGVHAEPRIVRYPRQRAAKGEIVALLKDQAGNRTYYPIDMVLDQHAGGPRLVVLLRVVADDNSVSSELWIMPPDGKSRVAVALKDKDVDLVTPTAIAREGPDTFVIADARDVPVRRAGESLPLARPGTLLRVRLQINDNKETVAGLTDLLAGLAADRNSLVYPTALVVERPGVFLVSDAGMKPNPPLLNRTARLRAEPAGLVRVRLGKDATGEDAQVAALATRGKLMWPTKMARDESTGVLLVTDQGEPEPLLDDKTLPWRGMPHRFGVSVLHSADRLDRSLFDPRGSADPRTARGRAIEQLSNANRGVQAVIDEQSPLHSVPVWKPVTEIL